MTDQSDAGLQVNLRAIKRNAILITVGSLLAWLGLVLSAKELADATRHYVDQMETSPTELARRRFLQAKQAATAGALAGVDAWSKGA